MHYYAFIYTFKVFWLIITYPKWLGGKKFISTTVITAYNIEYNKQLQFVHYYAVHPQRSGPSGLYMEVHVHWEYVVFFRVMEHFMKWNLYYHLNDMNKYSANYCTG